MSEKYYRPADQIGYDLMSETLDPEDEVIVTMSQLQDIAENTSVTMEDLMQHFAELEEDPGEEFDEPSVTDQLTDITEHLIHNKGALNMAIRAVAGMLVENHLDSEIDILDALHAIKDSMETELDMLDAAIDMTIDEED